MPIVTSADISVLLKEFWLTENLREVAYPKHPFYAMLKKSDRLRQRTAEFVIDYGRSPGRSATFLQAQANTGVTRKDRFALSHVRNYALFQLSTEATRECAGEGSIVRNLVDKSAREAARTLASNYATDLFRDGSGQIGRITAAGIVANAATLVAPLDIVHFYVGMRLRVTSSLTGAPRAGTAIVTSITRGLVTSTVTCAAGWPAGTVASDWIVQDGDYELASDRLKIVGLQGWIPDTDPAPGDPAFGGVDRSVDPFFLAGWRYNGVGDPVDRALIDGLNFGSLWWGDNGDPDILLLNPMAYAQLAAIVSSNAWLTIDVPVAANDGTTVATVGFSGLRLAYAGGTIPVLPDPGCPRGRGYPLRLDTWEMLSLQGGEMGWLDDDGLGRLVRMGTADAMEARMGGFPVLGCTCPAANGVILINA